MTPSLPRLALALILANELRGIVLVASTWRIWWPILVHTFHAH